MNNSLITQMGVISNDFVVNSICYFITTANAATAAVIIFSENHNNHNSPRSNIISVPFTFEKMNPPFIHPTAVIDDGAKIGSGTKIWHFCHIMSTAVVGDNCIIGQNVYIDKGVTIGNGVKIQNNVSIYNGVEIEDDVFIGPSVVFTNVINPRSFIERKNEFKKTLIKKGATIGANATIICGISIGKYAMVGAGSAVTKNVKSFALVYGNPAKQKGWVSKNGYRLIFNEQGNAICPQSGEKYVLQEEQVKIC